MALKLDYVVRETVSNLRRNLLMSIAAVLTVAVSLSLVGGALMLRQGVANATVQWRGDAELSIFMNADATQTQIDAIGAQLRSAPEVRRIEFVNKEEAYREAQVLFANAPDTLATLSVERMPPSYRVVPTRPEFIRGVGERFRDEPGVRRVTYAADQIQAMLTITRVLQVGLVAVAAILLGSAVLLILNTIRIAIFARRREISVMKLVGATNWFIRIPFMLEGLLQGLVGAAFAFGAVLAARTVMMEVAGNNDLPMLDQLILPYNQALATGFAVVTVGVIVGVIGSIVAVHRFLES